MSILEIHFIHITCKIQNSKHIIILNPYSPKDQQKNFLALDHDIQEAEQKKSTPEKTENDDGDPHRIRGITFTNCIFNIETSGQFKTRISELETELAACREQLEEARRESSGKEEHETAHGEDFPAEYDGHGLCSLVIRMRKEGKTEKEIAATLHGSGKWCSASQIGALLHRGGRVSADAMLKHAQRLLGKA